MALALIAFAAGLHCGSPLSLRYARQRRNQDKTALARRMLETPGLGMR